MTYTYKCIVCEHEVAVRVSINGQKPATRVCPECGGLMLREFYPVPTHFKGNGWGGDK